MFRITNTIQSLFNRRNVCQDVTDATFEQGLYKHSLLLGLSGYRSYSQAAEELGIKASYLRYIISTYKDEIGEPLHNPTIGNNNLLSIYQVDTIKRLLERNKA